MSRARRMLKQMKKSKRFIEPRLLSIPYLMNMIEETPICPCCGTKLENTTTERDTSPSLDRIDSSGDYTIDNVVLVCWGCNRRKNTLTSHHLIQLAKFYTKIDINLRLLSSVETFT